MATRRVFLCVLLVLVVVLAGVVLQGVMQSNAPFLASIVIAIIIISLVVYGIGPARRARIINSWAFAPTVLIIGALIVTTFNLPVEFLLVLVAITTIFVFRHWIRARLVGVGTFLQRHSRAVFLIALAIIIVLMSNKIGGVNLIRTGASLLTNRCQATVVLDNTVVYSQHSLDAPQVDFFNANQTVVVVGLFRSLQKNNDFFETESGYWIKATNSGHLALDVTGCAPVRLVR